ncbi:MAG: hypothetical protein H0X30_26355 [Anaerolineae bacterium]|nr:hypothetical protein [Anaerolineae bacterium]
MIPNNLPVVPTPFVGRTKDTQAIQGLLVDPTCRLLTLVGPGGIGKTRLSLHILQTIAETENPDYADGVYFVPLQSLDAPNLIIRAIAKELDFSFFPGDPQQQLLDYLCDKRVLLLLDNLEHLLEGAEVISAILSHAAGVRVLATSREALNLQEEWVYNVDGMGIPTADDLDSFESFSAVRLFIQSARRVHPAFSVENERAGIVRICSLVGGMPLGLELAAAWVRALSCEEIADEIASNLNILETSARNMPERHRTMRGVLAQSWTLLTAEEQQVMIRLAVFQGSFIREAAEVAARASLRVLSALVDKSWLRWDSDDRRYDIHELLRQYAEEQLIASEQADAARDAHAAYFAGWTQKREAEIKFQRQDGALEDIDCNFANVRLAWQRAMDVRNIDWINQMTEALNFFCDMRARFTEGLELFESASDCFADLEGSDNRFTYYRLRLRRARMVQNSQTYVPKDMDDLFIELEDILKAVEPFNCPMETAFTLYQIGFVQSFRSTDEVSLPYFTECVRIYSEAGDLFYKADSLHLLATSTKDFQISKDYYKEGYYIQKAIGDRNGMGWSLTQLARSNYTEHLYEAADQFNQQARVIQRERKDWKGLHFSLINNALWTFRRGYGTEAILAAEESLDVATTMHMLTPERASCSTLGLILIVTELDVARGQVLCEKVMTTFLPLVSSITEAEIDALNGLAIAAYLRGDITAAHNYYRQVVDQISKSWVTQTQDDILVNLATSGILVLDAQGQTALAVEIASQLSNIPDSPGLLSTEWVQKWPLLIRLREKWEAQLGTTAYTEAWERGKNRQLTPSIDLLQSGLDGLPEVAQSKPVPTNNMSLTTREQEVLTLLANGLSNREIATQLVFSLGTVKWYVNQIYGKLGVGSRTQAIVRARELQLLQ